MTGGAGFIGSHVVDRLLGEGWRVTVVDNLDPYYAEELKRANIAPHLGSPAYSFTLADICDLPALRAALPGGFDVIVHLAAKAGVRASIRDPVAYQRANVAGTQNLLELARERELRQFVFASSSSVYGINPEVPWRESDHVLLPISPYASTKVGGELMGHVYSHLYNMRFVALRFFTVHGPRQRPDLAIHKFARLMLAGAPVTVYGDGSMRRDYTYVNDIVDGIRAAIDYDGSSYEVINLGNDDTVSVIEMVRSLESALDVQARIHYLPPQPGDVPQTWADISKAARLLGYRPATPLGTGVRLFAEWLRPRMAQGPVEACLAPR